MESEAVRQPVVGRGKAAMRTWYTGFLSAFRTTKLTLSDREVFVGDGWASELGQYEWGLQPAAGGRHRQGQLYADLETPARWTLAIRSRNLEQYDSAFHTNANSN